MPPFSPEAVLLTAEHTWSSVPVAKHALLSWPTPESPPINWAGGKGEQNLSGASQLQPSWAYI